MARRRIRKENEEKRKGGVIFAREGCAIRHAAAQNRPLRPAAARIFLPLSTPLSHPTFFPPDRLREARARPRALLFVPTDRVVFSFRASARPRPRATMAACPKIRRWGGVLSRSPRVFFVGSPRVSPPFLAHSRPHSFSFFSLPFFSSRLLRGLHLPSASTSIRLSRRLRCSHVRCSPRLRPRGVF